MNLAIGPKCRDVGRLRRSTTLRALFPILDIDALFISLQKDSRRQDRVTLGERAEIMDANERLTDFLATAARRSSSSKAPTGTG